MASSGDLIADRRYAYADAALKEGDAAAAADLARQALELAPGFAAGWFLLGEAREAQFRALESDPAASAHARDAVAAYEAALACDPDDLQGARLRLAGLGVGDPLAAMGPGYVRALFDEYAIRFDRHLTASLKYRAPALLHDAVRRACSLRLRPFRFEQALDLGCGTGLAGEAFRPECGRLAGVDLSPAMIERARRKRVYDELSVGELVEWLSARPRAEADLVLAADVLVYLGNLAPLFAAAALALAHGGLLAVTVEAGTDGAALGPAGRYRHGEAHLRALAAEHGFAVALLEAGSTREDRGEPVPGLAAVLAR